jgi:hypothetical protein
MAKRKKGKLPARVLILWSAAEQQRFSEAVERLYSAINALEVILAEPKRRAEQANLTRKLKQAAEQAKNNLPPAVPVNDQAGAEQPSTPE